MPVADRKGLIPDDWTRLADDAAPASGGRVIVSLGRLKNEHNVLFSAASAVGVEVGGDVVMEDLLPFLPQLGLVVVRFAFMRDGRPFSVGRLLRERYGFKGDLRAAGDFIPDQALFLLRCGFTSFDVADTFPIETLKHSIAAYTAWYQRSDDRATTVIELRRKAAKTNGGGQP